MRVLVLLVVLLFASAPAHAEEGRADEPERSDEQADGAPPEERGEQANQTSGQGTDSSTNCELVRYYGVARPTYIMIDPDECYLPPGANGLVGQVGP